MAEIPDVVTLTTISKDWGNAIRSRTVQRYSSVANRTTEHPSPSEGDLSYLEDVNAVEVYDGSGWVRVGPPAGAIEAYGGSSAPSGWLLCDGAAVSRTTFAALFAVLGEVYGAGNGTTTFNLPNLQQRFPLGKATSGTGVTLGSTGGAIDHTHVAPDHQHFGPSHTHAVDPPSTVSGQSNTGEFATQTSLDGTYTLQSHTHNVDITQFNSGSSGNGLTTANGAAATTANNPPYQVVNYIVKT